MWYLAKPHVLGKSVVTDADHGGELTVSFVSNLLLNTGDRDYTCEMRPTQAILKSGRSAWKGPYFVPFHNLREALANHTPIKTQARSCTILPNFVGVKFEVHNGKEYLPVLVTQDMVGHKLGEFAFTKKRFTYKSSKK